MLSCSFCVCPVGGPQAACDCSTAAGPSLGDERLQQPCRVAQQATGMHTRALSVDVKLTFLITFLRFLHQSTCRSFPCNDSIMLDLTFSLLSFLSLFWELLSLVHTWKNEEKKCDNMMFSLVAWSHRCGLYHWDGPQHEAISGEHHSTCQGGVCSFVPVLAFMFITCISSTSVDFYCVTDGVITATAYVKQFCSPCILCQRNSLFDMHLNSVAVWPDHSHLPAAAVKEAEGQACPPAPWTNSLWGLLLSTAPGNTGQTWDHNSQKALFLFWAAECLYNCMFWFTLYDSTLHLACLLFPSSPCFFLQIFDFFPPSYLQTRNTLHFSEDEDAVIVGSLDFCSEYIDDCPWVSGTQYTPQGVRGQPDGSANNKDMVCESWEECVFAAFPVLGLKGTFDPKNKPLRDICHLTCNTVYPSRLLCCEWPSF